MKEENREDQRIQLNQQDKNPRGPGVAGWRISVSRLCNALKNSSELRCPSRFVSNTWKMMSTTVSVKSTSQTYRANQKGKLDRLNNNWALKQQRACNHLVKQAENDLFCIWSTSPEVTTFAEQLTLRMLSSMIRNLTWYAARFRSCFVKNPFTFP